MIHTGNIVVETTTTENMLRRVILFIPWICALLVLLVFIQIIHPLPCSAFVGGNVNRQQETRSSFPKANHHHRTISTSPAAQTYYFLDRCSSSRRQKHTIISAKISTRTISARSRTRTISITPATTRTTTTTTQLSLHPTAGASLALVGSSLFGMQISRFIPSGGILGTLVSAAFFGNVLTKWGVGIPNKHPLYDLCFTLFLPASLTLLLLAYRPPTTKDGIDTDDVEGAVNDDDDDAAQNSISACIRRIAMPFFITSLSSLLGCWLSYRCALTFRWFQCATTATATATAATATAVGMGKARELARITTGCMSASYVGGSVNFMSTARLIGAPADLLGSLVTADLFTMAIYFSFLSSSLDWEWFVSKFANDAISTKTTTTTTTKTTIEEMKRGKDFPKKSGNRTDLECTNEDKSPPSSSSPSELKSVCLASIPLLLSTFLIVQMANRVEDVVGRFVPGTACALIAIVAPILNSLVQTKNFWKPFSKAATVWSDFFFLSFFASIGVAANLSSALSMGPACLLFSTIALIVHVLGTVFGCLLWKRVMSMIGLRDTLDLEDVWIASNAAIGGPATAAAFCGRMKKRDPEKLQGRTISATVWGVVGYAIGTIVGVSVYQMV